MNARTVRLDRKTARLRERLITRLEAEPLGRALAAINHMLATIEDESTRMALLSARIQILRRRTEASRRGETPDMASSLGTIPQPPEEVVSAIEDEIVASDAETAVEEVLQIEVADEVSEWTRLRILEDCVVNGMRFPKGFRVEVASAEAERLVETGKAEFDNEDDKRKAAAAAGADAPDGDEADAGGSDETGADDGGADDGGADDISADDGAMVGRTGAPNVPG